jgi:hypothetical protein
MASIAINGAMVPASFAHPAPNPFPFVIKKYTGPSNHCRIRFITK